MLLDPLQMKILHAHEIMPELDIYCQVLLVYKQILGGKKKETRFIHIENNCYSDVSLYSGYNFRGVHCIHSFTPMVEPSLAGANPKHSRKHVRIKCFYLGHFFPVFDNLGHR